MPPSRSALLGDVDRLLDQGRPAVAGFLLDALEHADASRPELAIRRARSWLALGQPACALAGLNAAIALSAQSALFVWRARAWLAAGDPEQALADAATAASAMPADADAVGLCATLLIEAGEPAQAAIRLEHAIAAGATGVALHLALSVALSVSGGATAARAAALRGLAAYPQAASLRRFCADRRTGLAPPA